MLAKDVHDTGVACDQDLTKELMNETSVNEDSSIFGGQTRKK